MLDVDTLSTFMISIVTNYFTVCGDSLETILEDPTESHATYKVSSPGKQTLDFNHRQPDPVVAYSVDGMTICQSIDLVENEGEPFEIQKMSGTDMIFFPRPSSEMPFAKKTLLRKKHSHCLPEIQVHRKRCTDKASLIESKNPSFVLQTASLTTKNVISPSREVASKWIAMGFTKENKKTKNSVTTYRSTAPRSNRNHHNQQFPFDEMKMETNNSKRPPLAIRAQRRPTLQMPAATMTGARFNPSARNNKNMMNGIKSLEVRTPTSTTPTKYGDDNTLYLRNDNFVATEFTPPQKPHNHKKMPSQWKSAVDPRSGQTYYFHEITRETQWRKPMELASDEEKSAMEEKEQKEKDFFAAMEANILNSLSRGVIPGTPAQDRSSAATKEEESGAPDDERNASRIESRHSLRRVRSRAGRPEFVRTISTMDESVLTDVIRRQPSFRSVKSGLSKKDSSRQLDGLGDFLGSGSGHDSCYSSCSSSLASQGSYLETLEEDVGESSFSGLDNSHSNVSREDVLSRKDTKILGRSMSIRNDLNPQETQALNKLFSLTKEMMDADKEQPNDTSEMQRSNVMTPGPTIGARRRATESDIGRTLPRELELGDPDGKKEKEKPAPTTTSRRGRAARMLANSGKTAKDLLQSGVPRRNTCGTMYIRTTMSAPDKDATIRCVCGVYRSHIISSSRTFLGFEESESLAVFNDYPDDAYDMYNQNPTLDEITTFYRDIFYKAQMEADCIIMSLIYVERLIKKTDGNLRPKATNWRSLLFSCMILSSKVWDDLSMWNADFSQSCPPGGVNFSLQRINQLELAILNTLKFNVKVPASEYAKYYFLLRSMLIKSGLGGEDLGSLNPLDVDGARRLAQVSSQFESMSLMDSATSLDFQRSKSLAVESSKSLKQPKTKVGLEQVVKM